MLRCSLGDLRPLARMASGQAFKLHAGVKRASEGRVAPTVAEAFFRDHLLFDHPSILSRSKAHMKTLFDIASVSNAIEGREPVLTTSAPPPQEKA
jgi:hypothetical protein